MIFKLIGLQYINIITFISLIAAFLTTCLVIKSCQGMLPRDQGRAFAINGKDITGKAKRCRNSLHTGIFSIFTYLCTIFKRIFNLHNTCNSFNDERLSR